MADLTREERADWRQWLSYPGGADDNAPLTRGEALRLLDALDAAEADRRIAEAARTWGQTMRLTTSDLDGDHDETVFRLGMKAAAAHVALLAALDAEAHLRRI